MSQIPDQSGDSPRGLAYAIAAYGLWGFLPLYMKALAHIPATEIVPHRVLWAVPIALLVMAWQGRMGELRAVLSRPRVLLMAALTAALISTNWLIYVWSIANDRALEAALGYYINPLFSVFLGWALLGEKLGRAQLIAIALASAAVIILTVQAGRLPLVAIGLTLTFGFYAYFKRSLPVGPTLGFALEVLVLTPLALAYALWLAAQGTSHFATTDWRDTLLLIGCGPVTAVPLLFYANGAKLVRLSTMGVLQYIAPTMIFLTAVLLFGEPFGGAQMIAFPMIWAALVIYSAALIREARHKRAGRPRP